MEVEIYKLLSRYYHYGWEDFALKYIDLISALLVQNRVDRAEILDLACGTGMLAYELAVPGHTVTGLDQSPEMIELARHKCRNLPRANFVIGDMAEFELSQKFDLITCTYDSINYLTEPAQLRSYFRSVSGHLKAGALFIFDSNTEAGYKRMGNQVFTHDFKGEKLIHRCAYDANTGLSKIEFEFTDGSLERHVQRPYGLADLEPYFDKNGLELQHAFGGFKRDIYDENSGRMFCVVRKI